MKQKLNKKIFLFSLGIFLILPIIPAFAYDGCCPPPEDPPSGTLSVNSTQVYLGETIILTVEGEDQNGLYSLGAYYNGRWHNQYVGRAVSTSRTWYIRERAPGVYRYCGRIVGYMANGYSWNRETVPTSPDCIEVEVLCPPCEGPGCPENNVSSTSS